ncbi:hypothetical protein MVEN_02586800 [Mycena venus]|uniref:Small ribosomal subunit protein mS29 n=1 Tax=Mycena venus TaxID=2733690 RepID=A0A8H6U1J1_9AGAR|nr:hypothetical protein MVEN_02586800 [Mycena venus]
MFLLGRGLLGPAPLLRFGARYKKKRSAYAVASPNQNAKGKSGKAVIQRDAQGRPIIKQREKSLGTFKPLGAGGLTHVLFENEGPGRVELDVPPMRPRMLAPGVPTRFHDTDPTSPMRVYGVPKHMLLEFRMLGTPCSITTSTTLSLIRALEESKDAPSRLVLNGRPGVGKSFLLLQAAQYASASREWIRTLRSPMADRTFAAGTPLTALIEFGLGGASDASSAGTAPSVDALLRAPFVLDAVMAELGAQEEFPVLIVIDDFQALCGRSLYKDPRFKTIRPHHLSMPRLLLEYAGGRKKLARGLVLTALTRTDPQFPVPPQLADALRLGNEFTKSPRSVGYRRSTQLAAYLEGEVEEPTDPFAYLDSNEPELSDEDSSAALSSSALPDSEELSDAEESYDSDANAELASALQRNADADADTGEPRWMGWTAYDPPTYEDSEEWRTMVMPREENEWDGEAHELGALAEAQEDAELAEDEDGADLDGNVDSVAGQEDGKKKKKKKGVEQEDEAEPPKTRKVRALRAIRVPDALSVREAAGLFEVWLDAGVLRTGGQRRRTRRAELDAREEYRAVKAAVDADPETAYDAELADAVESDSQGLDASSSAPPPSTPAQRQPTTRPASFSSVASRTFAKPAPSAAKAAAEAAKSEDDEKKIAQLRAELEGGAFDVVRALEQDAEGRQWALKRAAEDAQVESLDAEVRVLPPRAPHDSNYPGDEGLEEVEGTPVRAEEASAEEDLVRAAEALGESADADAAAQETYTPLELGPDPQIAHILSEGVRDAFADPDSVGDLLRTNTADVDEVLYGNENDEDLSDEEDVGEEDEFGSGNGVKAEKEAREVEEETGADELFLSKYQESSGNARTFVKGLVGTLQTSG